MWQEEASGVWRHEAEPGSSGRPGQPARLPEPPEPECGAEWDAGRVSESESVPTWDPRWLQPVTWWPGGPVTSDKVVTSEASDTLVILTGSSWLSPWAKRRAGAVIGGLGPRRGVDREVGAIRPSMWGPTGWRKHSAKDKQVGAQLVWRGWWCYITTKEATPLTHSLPNTRYLLIKQIVF